MCFAGSDYHDSVLVVHPGAPGQHPTIFARWELPQVSGKPPESSGSLPGDAILRDLAAPRHNVLCAAALDGRGVDTEPP